MDLTAKDHLVQALIALDFHRLRRVEEHIKAAIIILEIAAKKAARENENA
jgi:hypothetical protein